MKLARPVIAQNWAVKCTEPHDTSVYYYRCSACGVEVGLRKTFRGAVMFEKADGTVVMLLGHQKLQSSFHWTSVCRQSERLTKAPVLSRILNRWRFVFC